MFATVFVLSPNRLFGLTCISYYSNADATATFYRALFLLWFYCLGHQRASLSTRLLVFRMVFSMTTSYRLNFEFLEVLTPFHNQKCFVMPWKNQEIVLRCSYSVNLLWMVLLGIYVCKVSIVPVSKTTGEFVLTVTISALHLCLHL